MQLVDTHSHLNDEQFCGDLDSVIDRAVAAGVEAILVMGTTVVTSRQAIELSRRFDIVHPAVGIHPNYAVQAGPDDWREITELAQNPGVVAIGETGLDRFRNDTPFDVQLDYFERHVRLACARRLPVVIHSREAERDVLDCIERIVAETSRSPAPSLLPHSLPAAREESTGVRGVMHSFTGDAATAARSIELGLHISFAGQITYTNRKFDSLREVARMIAADRVLVETDSPYLAPEPYRGQRNEPAFVSFTAKHLAEIRGIHPDELGRLTTENSHRLFGYPAIET